MTIPAILGGRPAFPDGLPFARPPRPALEAVAARLQPSYERGVLTNGRLVAELEERAAERLGVRHVVAVASCTAGLMLVVRSLSPDGGPAVLPSFTFSASAHALAWNGCRPRFAECDVDTFQLDVADAEARADGASVLMGTHVFGSACDTAALEDLGERIGAPVVFDAAHGFGGEHRGRAIGGFGDAEVFSLSPTKLVVAGEGGLVATNRDDVAASVRRGRDYGNPGDYDTRFVGLNARMSELHAAMALESLAELDAHLARRRTIARRYREAFESVPGIRVQPVPAEDLSTYKDLTITVDPAAFGVGRDELRTALLADGIDTRAYFDPPVHRQQAYRDLGPTTLPVTDLVASRVLSLPIFRDLTLADVDRIIDVVRSVHRHAEQVTAQRRTTAANPSARQLTRLA